jgi:hypothetical protein
MSRRIYCNECHGNWKPHRQDVKEGWHYRTVFLSIKKPAVHTMTITTDGTTKTSDVASVYCDLCGNAIPDGSIAMAITMWRENLIGDWEHEFGTVLPPEAVKMVQTLEKGVT